MNETESIGERIVRARAALGLSQNKLADLAGVAPTQIARWERNKATPRPTTLHKLASLLDVSPQWLERGEGALNEHEYPGEPTEDEKEVIANLSDDQMRILRIRAHASGRTLGKELAAIAEDFLFQWERQVPPPGWVKLKVPEGIERNLADSAEKNGRSLVDEISARLHESVEGRRMADGTREITIRLPEETYVELESAARFLGSSLDDEIASRAASTDIREFTRTVSQLTDALSQERARRKREVAAIYRILDDAIDAFDNAILTADDTAPAEALIEELRQELYTYEYKRDEIRAYMDIDSDQLGQIK